MLNLASECTTVPDGVQESRLCFPLNNAPGESRLTARLEVWAISTKYQHIAGECISTTPRVSTKHVTKVAPSTAFA